MNKEQLMKGAVNDAQAAAKILQYGDNVVMPSNDVDTSALEQNVATQDNQQVAPEQTANVEPVANQEPISASQMQQMLNQNSQVQTETNDNISAEEQQRRTWQGERDKAVADNGTMQTQLDQLANQNTMLMQAMAGMGVNNQAQAPQVQAPQVDAKPTLKGFTEGIEYDPADATDPNTDSGRAFNDFHEALARYNARSEFNQLNQKSQAEKAQQGFLVAANQIAQAHPEYRDMFGGPDLVKIQNHLNTYNDPNNLIKLFGGGQTNDKKETPATPNGLQKIGLRADHAQSIASTPAATTTVVNKNESEVIQRFKGIYG
ncbi:MAG: hypothetical protein KAS32_26320 [Candidatus Peribacteraceae bacterium]|nr:hypothetical protein [Candidatus Peribacteraceae bacterium]